MSFPRVFVTRRWPVDAADVVGPGVMIDVFAHERGPTREELIDRGRACGAIVTSVADRIDRELLEQLPSLRVIAQAAVGYDNVDVYACRARGVIVTHTPGVLTESTADLALALLLACARRVREGEAMVREGRFGGWSPTMLLGHELDGKTLGLIGYGRIARAVARRADAFGMRVIASTRGDVPFENEPYAVHVTLRELLAESDVISLHVPGSRATRHLIGEPEFARMKRGVVLINTARGTVVDEAAMVRALERGQLGGAGLDVYEEEPRVHPGLVARDDVVLLPHLGSATREARARMASSALRDAMRVLRGDEPVHLVPELRVPELR
ncbi:2-hydroxyacid dehydrogenase [Sandaracinus amylolyticus]|uniref:2-hydroxyacid dehydrogenase n=1 Tax=Sandaracinus amylolyticus TaxID=927083 RepID=UPI00069FB4EF|nr:D-glycerate dehydrogenase [Sandaracinus amylolyticus]